MKTEFTLVCRDVDSYLTRWSLAQSRNVVDATESRPRRWRHQFMFMCFKPCVLARSKFVAVHNILTMRWPRKFIVILFMWWRCKALSTAEDFHHLWDEGNGGGETALRILHILRMVEQWTRPFIWKRQTALPYYPNAISWWDLRALGSIDMTYCAGRSCSAQSGAISLPWPWPHHK